MSEINIPIKCEECGERIVLNSGHYADHCKCGKTYRSRAMIYSGMDISCLYWTDKEQSQTPKVGE